VWGHTKDHCLAFLLSIYLFMALFSTSGDYTDASCLIFFWLGETLEFVAKPNNEVHVPHSPETIFIYFP